MDVSGKQKVLVDVVVQCLYGDAQFRMISQDHIRRLSLFDQRTDNAIQFPEFFFSQVNTGTGIREKFLIHSVCGVSIIIILCLDGALVPGLITAIADIRSLLYLPAGFPFKPRADIVAPMAGTAKSIADNKLVAGVGLFTMVAMDTEVVGIVKTAPVPCVYNTMFPNLFGDGGGIFAEIFGNFSEGFPFIKRFFNVLAVSQRKMFVVTRDQVRHKVPPYCRRTEGDVYSSYTRHGSCERLKSSYERLKSGRVRESRF